MRNKESLEASIGMALDVAMETDAQEHNLGRVGIGHSKMKCQKKNCQVDEVDCIFFALPAETPCVYMPSRAYIAQLGCLELQGIDVSPIADK